MRRLFGFLFGLTVGVNAGAAGTFYYVDPLLGSSANSGLTSALPKSNCSQVPEAAGDIVLFARGREHYGSCTLVDGVDAATPTRYGAYGSGTQPILRHSGNVFVKNDAAFMQIEDVVLWPTTQGGSDAGLRTDRAHHIRLEDVELVGGFDGWRIDAVSGAASIYNLEMIRVKIHDQLSEGVRWVLGSNDALDTYAGYNITWQDVEIYNTGKEPFRLTYQGTVNRTWYSVNFDNIYVHDSMKSTPKSPAAVNDDQCMHFRNLRETVKGNSRLTRLRIENCGRRRDDPGNLVSDTSLLTGLWLEGLTNVIVEDVWIDGVYTPGNDGGALFLDSSAADGSGYNSENNDFRRLFITDVRGNDRCTPLTSTQCNNSDAISVTRAASNNLFEDFVLTDSVVGLHVTGNAQVNTFKNGSISGNEIGVFVQTNSADTPAGLAQVFRNVAICGNKRMDWQNTTSFPKADEQYDLICSIVNDSVHGTTLTSDPQWIGGTSVKRLNDLRPKATSPLCTAGLPLAGTYYDGERIGQVAAIGAFGCARKPLDGRRW